MSKLYNGNIKFSVGIVQSGAVPLDDRSVVRSFSDLLKSETFGLSAYEGMLVAVVEDQQVYMLVDKANATSEESWIDVYMSCARAVPWQARFFRKYRFPPFVCMSTAPRSRVRFRHGFRGSANRTVR